MIDRPDAELVAAARNGDKEAFGTLVERHQPTARRAARRMIGDEELARDLVQEALLQAYLSLKRLRDDARFASWLYGIVLNVCRNYLRNQKTQFYSLDAQVGGLHFQAVAWSPPTPQQLAEERELHQLVLDAINSLSPENRAATLLFYYDGLTLREMAASLGISVVAAKGRLHKSRQQLRAKLITELRESLERSNDMVEMTVADVVRRESKDETTSETRKFFVIVLQDASRQRALPIWVGDFEGHSIAMAARGMPSERPLTFSFIARLLEAAGAQLEKVRIEALKGDVFYAVATVRNGDQVREIDARPSDAIALALHTSSPIFAAEEVLERAGARIPKLAADFRAGRGMAQIEQEAETAARTSLARRAAPKSKEELQRSMNELMTFVFGES